MNVYKNIPTLDLHGMDREYAVFKTKEFIQDYYKLKQKELSIIHGIGSGILRNEIHRFLKTEKMVKEYKINIYNGGETIVTLRI